MITIQHTQQLKRGSMVFLSRHLAGSDHSLPLARFSYDHSELKKLELKVKRKLQVLRMFSDLKDFDYEPPKMSYDKKTGEIKIESKKEKDSSKGGRKSGGKKFIGNMDDLEKEKKALYDEVGLDNEGRPKDENESVDAIADKLKAV